MARFWTVPADLGVLFTVQQLPQDQPLKIASYLSFRGTFSGGTARSAIKEWPRSARGLRRTYETLPLAAAG